MTMPSKVQDLCTAKPATGTVVLIATIVGCPHRKKSLKPLRDVLKMYNHPGGEQSRMHLQSSCVFCGSLGSPHVSLSASTSSSSTGPTLGSEQLLHAVHFPLRFPPSPLACPRGLVDRYSQQFHSTGYFPNKSVFGLHACFGPCGEPNWVHTPGANTRSVFEGAAGGECIKYKNKQVINISLQCSQ